MPTGYTYMIEDRNDVTFEEFALGCARTFGALVSMIDEPKGAKIPEEFKPDDGYLRDIEFAKKMIEKFETMSLDEAQVIIDDEYKLTVKNNQEQLTKVRESNKKYDHMIEKVNKWTPPTIEHFELKKFMLEQLEVSKSSTDYYEREVEKSTPEEYIERHLNIYKERLIHHKECYKRNVEGCRKKNEWISKLRDSLK